MSINPDLLYQLSDFDSEQCMPLSHDIQVDTWHNFQDTLYLLWEQANLFSDGANLDKAVQKCISLVLKLLLDSVFIDNNSHKQSTRQSAFNQDIANTDANQMLTESMHNIMA